MIIIAGNEELKIGTIVRNRIISSAKGDKLQEAEAFMVMRLATYEEYRQSVLNNDGKPAPKGSNTYYYEISID